MKKNIYTSWKTLKWLIIAFLMLLGFLYYQWNIPAFEWQHPLCSFGDLSDGGCVARDIPPYGSQAHMSMFANQMVEVGITNWQEYY